MDRSIPADVYNLGTNTGHSNLEVILQATVVTKIPVTHKNGPPREGDPAVLTADAGKFIKVSGWKPKFDLNDMITHAWDWYNK
jgi:UDP-glucose 4-epimerase